jgi:hypothetical protein
VAGHVGLELRNVGKNYPFERSRRFPGDKPNRGHREYSRLSCGEGKRGSFFGAEIGHDRENPAPLRCVSDYKEAAKNLAMHHPKENPAA